MHKLLSLLCILPLCTIAQTFQLSDSDFKTGDILTAPQIVFEQEKWGIKENGKLFLDSFAVFMNNNPMLMVEVGVYTMRDLFSEARFGCVSCSTSKSIADYLSSKGVDRIRLRDIGHNTWPPAEKDTALHAIKLVNAQNVETQLNSKIEFKIVLTDFAPEQDRFLCQEIELKCDSGQNWCGTMEVNRRRIDEMVKFVIPHSEGPVSILIQTFEKTNSVLVHPLFIQSPLISGSELHHFWMELKDLPDGNYVLTLVHQNSDNKAIRKDFELRINTRP